MKISQRLLARRWASCWGFGLMEAAEQREKTHNPRMSAGCQRPGGTAIKAARTEGLGWAAGELVRNKTTRRVTAEAQRREAVSAPGSRRTSRSDSLAAGEPRQAGRQQLRVHSKAAFPRAAYPGAPEQPGAGCALVPPARQGTPAG